MSGLYAGPPGPVKQKVSESQRTEGVRKVQDTFSQALAPEKAGFSYDHRMGYFSVRREVYRGRIIFSGFLLNSPEILHRF